MIGGQTAADKRHILVPRLTFAAPTIFPNL
jgi:hypothetical protein